MLSKIATSIFFFSFMFLLSSCNTSGEVVESKNQINELIKYTQDRSDFSYVIEDTIDLDKAKLYRIRMNSGKWLTEDFVNEPIWWHMVDVVVPNSLNTQTSLLFIGPGSTSDTTLRLDSLSIQKAIETKSIVSHVSNIPFQPLRFRDTDSIERYEDGLIAYGWNKFLSQGAQEKDVEWLARFPMTRAVVRAMDVVQELTKEQPYAVKNFFISGASKRGWTTWTTAAVDSRVIGMAPLVIDLLNLVPSFEHHFRLYGEWSPAVQDYVDFKIMKWLKTEEFEKLLSYVEPYQFKKLFTMPKLIINGTIDEFFATDSWKFYWDELPGDKYLHYVPNANHGLLGSYQTQNILSFYHRLIYNEELPRMKWKIENGTFYITVDKHIPHEISLWTINNSSSRDFRIWQVGRNWKKESVQQNNDSGTYKIQAPNKDGYTASLVEIVFYPESENPLVLSTGTCVLPDVYQHPRYTSEKANK